jgi:hypothetical protein
MLNLGVYECLEQLIKVYVYAGEQYIQEASEASHPVYRKFMEQRAFERMRFVEEIQDEIYFNTRDSGVTFREIYNWHVQLHGKNSLHRVAITKIDDLIIDEKAEDICTCLIHEQLPDTLRKLIRKHLIRIEASLLTLFYLRAIHKS